MAEASFKGFEKGSKLDRWVSDITGKQIHDDILEDIGKRSVRKTVSFIKRNRVRPATTQKTFAARRGRKEDSDKEEGGKAPITLLDTGIGIKQISHEVRFGPSGGLVAVGVPDGYMAYHQQGRVPNAPKREFLKLPTKGQVIKTVEFYWKKATK